MEGHTHRSCNLALARALPRSMIMIVRYPLKHLFVTTMCLCKRRRECETITRSAIVGDTFSYDGDALQLGGGVRAHIRLAVLPCCCIFISKFEPGERSGILGD